MNIEKLKEAEKSFLSTYPEGFQDEEMLKIAKKHKVNKISMFTQEVFEASKFNDLNQICEDAIRLVSKSSMVSLFEKPKFRDAVRSFSEEEKRYFVNALKSLLHGKEEEGFNLMIHVLLPYKLAKWTLITVFRCYYYPTTDLLFKPTTVKNIISKYELNDIKYSPKPTYEFFVKYRGYINEMKQHVDQSLSPNNASFSGFLMLTM